MMKRLLLTAPFATVPAPGYTDGTILDEEVKVGKRAVVGSHLRVSNGVAVAERES